MKILVTGGAGYIGSHTVRALVKEGHSVVVFDNLVYGHKEAVPSEVKFVEGDLKDKELVLKVLMDEKIEAVMHFAAYAYVGESVENPRKYFENNVICGLNLLNAMVDTGVKYIVFSSTCATYGEPENMPITENVPQQPCNPYGRSKLMFEMMLKSYEVYGLRNVCLRYFNAAGADPGGKIGEDHNPETHLIPLVLQVALGQREAIKIFGADYDTPDGTCIRDYIHVNDLARAHILALNKIVETGKSNFYNLGTGDGTSVKEIIEVCRHVTKHPIPAAEEGRRAGDPPRLVASSEKIKKELGWEPEFDVRAIIESAWKWHKNHPEGFN
ncbi:UDP-glucose 4-epimerase GalE [Candidatus Woesearchaeota archaeon]|nr:UDP-glucose 4-epimerase GalE [Candidatus Woesearchaeota archaeon]